MLRADSLIFAYPGQAKPYAFSFEAAPGEITAFTGPSGSGKSTLLDLIAGFITPQSGEIVLNGAPLVHLSPEKRPVSLLLQSDNLFDHLSAGRNIELGLPRGTAKSQAQTLVTQALAEIGLSGLASQRVATMSGGQKQRVALARTLLRKRPVLLLDEPFSALDDDTRATIRSLVVQLTVRHAWHTILVSHHTDDVTQIARRRYGLIDGEFELY